MAGAIETLGAYIMRGKGGADVSISASVSPEYCRRELPEKHITPSPLCRKMAMVRNDGWSLVMATRRDVSDARTRYRSHNPNPNPNGIPLRQLF